ncbi:expressed unknown protein (Partial), partial [Seminavis robusta]|eukprot:Sro4227_g353450.1 n/a (143) ;mRNA; f:2150-2580
MSTFAKKNLARSRASATTLGCLCLLVVCSLAAATTPEFETQQMINGNNALHASASSDDANTLAGVSGRASTGSKKTAEEGQSLWSQQPPKVALLETRSETSESSQAFAAPAPASTAASVSDKINNSNNNNSHNNVIADTDNNN